MSEKSIMYNCIVNALAKAGCAMTDDDNWSLLITSPHMTNEEAKSIQKNKKCNHFPGCYNLGRKDMLWKAMQLKINLFPVDYNIIPKSWIMPFDYKDFILNKDDPENDQALWILKPTDSSCGKGISILTRNGYVPKRAGQIISKYIINPHLIDGFKYDLRLYVLVPSYDPLKIYFYYEGLVRFATVKYSTETETIDDMLVHLTNFSINKNGDNYVYNEEADDDGIGSKWSLSALKRKFKQLNLNFDLMMIEIKDLIIKTMIAIQPHILSKLERIGCSNDSYFELYGFDVMMDSNLKPWLLEINTNPSLSSSSPLDKMLKTSLVCDVFNLIGIRVRSSNKLNNEIETGNLKTINKKKKISEKNRIFEQKQIEKTKKQVEELKEDKKFKSKIIKKKRKDELIIKTIEEDYRKGDFEKLFPLSTNISKYKPYFAGLQTENDKILWKWLKNPTKYTCKHLKILHQNPV